MDDKNAQKIIELMEKGFTEVNQKIENLAISTQEQFSLIDKRFVVMDSRMDTIEKRIEQLDNTMQASLMANNMKLSKILTYQDDISKRVGVLEEA